jgi:hypothetical protein
MKFFKFVEILEKVQSTNSVNGGNKRMFSRSQYVIFQVINVFKEDHVTISWPIRMFIT